MKRLSGLVVAFLLLSPIVFAQEHYSEGPVWRVQLVRVKPTHMDEYLTSLQQVSKPLLEEEKREGLILDYKFFFKETKNNPQVGTFALPFSTRTTRRWMASAQRQRPYETRS